MQPFYEVTVARPWHWGIAIVSAPGAEVPDTLGDSLVTSGSDALVINVHHAQDIDAAVFEGDWDWAIATIHVRSLGDLGEAVAPIHHEGVLMLADGRLAVGDADSEVVVNDLSPKTRVRVQAHDAPPHGATEVWIDLAPDET